MSIVLSVNLSKTKGNSKKPTNKATAIKNFGLFGDAHALKNSIRQISLLDVDEIKAFSDLIGFGDFAENITTSGLDVGSINVGSILEIGNVLAKVSQIGKTCHESCNIKKILGSCIMPKKGIFCKVVKGGLIKQGASIKIIK